MVDKRSRELRISTMTTICSMGNLHIDLSSLFEETEPNDKIVNLQYLDKTKGTVVKKVKRRKNKYNEVTEDRKVRKRVKCFYNQLTAVMNIDGKKVNAKIFKNGTIQCTGIKNKGSGMDICKYICKHICKKDDIVSFKIVLINSDFSIGWEIKRIKLFELLTTSGMFSTYEPCIYPGVNTKYFWNKSHMNRPLMERGVCNCTNMCNGKGDGNGDGRCKRVTIASFQSGTTIITGANSMEQLRDVYAYIQHVYSTFKEQLQKEKPLEQETGTKGEKESRIDYVVKKR